MKSLVVLFLLVGFTSTGFASPSTTCHIEATSFNDIDKYTCFNYGAYAANASGKKINGEFSKGVVGGIIRDLRPHYVTTFFSCEPGIGCQVKYRFPWH